MFRIHLLGDLAEQPLFISDPVLTTLVFLDASSIFNYLREKIILLCPISPDFREGGSEQIREGA